MPWAAGYVAVSTGKASKYREILAVSHITLSGTEARQRAGAGRAPRCGDARGSLQRASACLCALLGLPAARVCVCARNAAPDSSRRPRRCKQRCSREAGLPRWVHRDTRAAASELLRSLRSAYPCGLPGQALPPVACQMLTRPAFGRCAQWERFRLVLVAG